MFLNQYCNKTLLLKNVCICYLKDIFSKKYLKSNNVVPKNIKVDNCNKSIKYLELLQAYLLNMIILSIKIQIITECNFCKSCFIVKKGPITFLKICIPF